MFGEKKGDFNKELRKVSGLMTTAVHSITPSELKNKIPDTSGFITTSVLNTEIGEVENKIHGVSCLVNKTDCNAKILDHKMITINVQRKHLKRKK